jgi:hypothetical protein
MRTAVTRLLLTGFASLTALACESGTGTAPSISLTLSEQSTSVAQSGSRTITVTIARSKFDKPVLLTVTGLPTGVTGAFNPSSVTGTSSVLQLSASGAAAPGASTLTITASGEGITDQTVTLDLTVNVTGSFTLNRLESAVTVAQGGGGNTSVLITRAGGFAGNVTLAISGAPAGLTPTFDATPAAGNSVAVRFAATGSVAAGSHTLTATGTSPGLPDQQTTLTVEVVAPPATSNVTLTFCATNMPVWFAYKNHGYGWQTLTASGTSFTFAATDRVGVAVTFISPDNADNQTNVTYGTRAELASQMGRDCSGMKSVNGSVSGLSTAHTARIVMGAAGASPPPTQSAPTFVLSNIADRPLDLIGTLGISSGSSFTPEKIIIRRSINPASGETLPVLNFGAAEAISPQQTTVTLNNLSPGDQNTLINTFWSATSSFGSVQNAQPGGTSVALFSVPAAQQVAGDVHELYLDAFQSTSSVGRSMLQYYSAPGNRTETFGPFLSVPQVSTLASAPYIRMRARLDAQAEYSSAVRFGFYQEPGTNDSRLVYVQVSAGYLGGAPAVWDGFIPDFVGLSGFSNGWMLTSGQPTLWQAIAFGGRTELLTDAMPVDGDQLRFSDRQGIISANNLRVVYSRALPRSQYFRR